jgi:hypothetical protein
MVGECDIDRVRIKNRESHDGRLTYECKCQEVLASRVRLKIP